MRAIYCLAILAMGAAMPASAQQMHGDVKLYATTFVGGVATRAAQTGEFAFDFDDAKPPFDGVNNYVDTPLTNLIGHFNPFGYDYASDFGGNTTNIYGYGSPAGTPIYMKSFLINGLVNGSAIIYDGSKDFFIQFNEAPGFGTSLFCTDKNCATLAYDFAVSSLSATSAVPEIGSWAMLLLGSGMIGYILRKMRPGSNPVALNT